jgi:hypothetical protein
MRTSADPIRPPDAACMCSAFSTSDGWIKPRSTNNSPIFLEVINDSLSWFINAYKFPREHAQLACALHFRSRSHIKQPSSALTPPDKHYTHVYIFDFIAFINRPARPQFDLTFPIKLPGGNCFIQEFAVNGRCEPDVKPRDRQT